MTNKNSRTHRRTVLKAAALGAAVLPIPGLIARSSAQSDDLPRLSEDAEAAQALSYVHDGDSSDVREDSSEYCYNCHFFTGDQSSEWGGCTIFPGEAVNRDGWCEAWVEA